MKRTRAGIAMADPETRRRAASAPVALLAALLLGACGGADQEGTPSAEEGMATDTTPPTATPSEPMAEGLLDPNEASEAAIRAIEGLPEEAAAALLEGRPFEDVLALDQALSAHMDSAARAELYRRVWIPIDLNEASDEAILLIPGVGDRMLHEFKEYRPYRAMEQFRREIGKYVDDEEVARFERYVSLGGGM